MSLHHPTEQIAREAIEGLQTEIDRLIDVPNDNNRAAWEMAAAKATEIARTAQIAADAIHYREYLKVTGQDVKPATTVSVEVALTPTQQNAAALAAGFDQILSMVRPA